MNLNKLPEIPWYMDLGAKARNLYRDCPLDIKNEISFFLDHGYVVLKNSLPPERIESARNAFYRHKKKYANIYARHADVNGLQRRIVNLHMALYEFQDIFSLNTRALKIQDYLFQSPSTCFTSLTFESGSEQSIHRDSPYFTTTPEYYYLGVWVALERVDHLNGALEIYDGGHLVHEVDRFEIFERYYKYGDQIDQMDPRLWADYQQATIESCIAKGLEKKIVPMEPGDTLIWHPHLPHGGSAISSQGRSRLSIVNHVVPSGVPVSGLNVFYRNSNPPDSVNYGYMNHADRNFLIHKNVEFQHADPQPANEFRN
ncbi:phytanoyl-CoA dioxygenase family protein [Polynucleobacter asymbioticus]|uniref:Phytanoyl-CoA dioxygenase n=1 Tax=Polynucleobacter asymbioticus (strain DSM 18221 / CIP 109841 / QLW-P1DMWA-1) TaxID=312153 RepID=A4SVN0_POLAQ|nr:phytanoyl-CoA dioxygenase family protein [Polynucleobacter asymbioticus]ABP33544.1 Phytanoyl-CoA dioxygenase [Polynucleobacter asymbioticus QLW-P1DMWA-1]